MDFDKVTIAYFRYAHGFFNLLIMIMFFLQASIGLRIRRARKKENSLPTRTIKVHRVLGPLLTLSGMTGFLAGLSLVYIDHGTLWKYPLHLIFGLAITVALISTFTVSKRIKASEPHWRDIHLRIGIAILNLYVLQSVIGISILL